MKKRLNLCIIGILMIFLINFNSASITLHSQNIKDKYYIGEKLSGQMVLEIVNESIDSLVSSSLGDSVNIIDLIKKNGLIPLCEPYDCSPRYIASNPTLSKSIQINEDEEKIFGFMIFGEKVQLTDLSLNISSDFGEEDKVPLSLLFFKRALWIFNEPSTDYSKSESWGCYETDIPSGGIGISPYEKFDISSTSSYCEKIHLPESGYVRTGARLEGNSQNELKISVYSTEDPSQEFGSCHFKMQEGYCDIERVSEWYGEGDYYFCLGLKDPSERLSGTISIFRENYGSSCGWYVPQGYKLSQMVSSNSSIDYSIYAKTSKYAESRQVIVDNLKVADLIKMANTYLNLSYKNKCINGCVLPVYVSGVKQLLDINNVQIGYEIISSSGGITHNNQIYDVTNQSARFNFYGTLDLDKVNLTSGKGTSNLVLTFNNNKLLEKSISSFPGPIVGDLTPRNPPAGLKTKFNINVQSFVKISKYEWFFGDNESAQTSNNTVEHMYKNIGSFNLKLIVTDINNVSVIGNYLMDVTSPMDFINVELAKKLQRLDNLTMSIVTFPQWYQDAIKRKINFTEIQSNVRNLAILKSGALSNTQIVDAFLKLQGLEVPSYVFISEQSSSPIVTSLDNINPEVVIAYSGERMNSTSIEDYQTSISRWQQQNVLSEIKKIKISFFDGYDNINPLLNVYSIKVKPNTDEESYLIINDNINNLYFKLDQEPIKQEMSTMIVLNPREERSFDFYDLNTEEISFFVSPKLSTLSIIENIEKCNFNGICEKELGENYIGCRNDCKPLLSAFFYIILLFIILLGFYTFLARWYRNNYEKSLFRNKKDVYNIVMFILNSRLNGFSDWRTRDMLGKQGWRFEQISYCMRKANGKGIGIPEIIPIDKIKLMFMNMKAKKNVQNIQIPGIRKW